MKLTKKYIILLAFSLVIMTPGVSIAEGCEQHKQFLSRIKTAVQNKNGAVIASFIRYELSNGPRKSYLVSNDFDKVFPESWQTDIKNASPDCDGVGSKGHMMASGLIWYNIDEAEPYIFAINGINPELTISEESKDNWQIEGKVVAPQCITRVWRSGDNYEEFYEQFKGVQAEYEDPDYLNFIKYIGKYWGTQIPFGPIKSGWGDDVSLSEDLSSCSYNSDDELAASSYNVLKTIPVSVCEGAISSKDVKCLEAVILKVFGPTGYSSLDVDYSVYGALKQGERTWIAPLINFDNLPETLNYIEKYVTIK